jgi:hypothetical protein
MVEDFSDDSGSELSAASDLGSMDDEEFMKFSSLPQHEDLWIVNSKLIDWDMNSCGRPGKRQAFQVGLPNGRCGWVKLPLRFLKTMAELNLGDIRFTTLKVFGMWENPTRYRYALKPLGRPEIYFF